jgi:CBS domain-containing protein
MNENVKPGWLAGRKDVLLQAAVRIACGAAGLGALGLIAFGAFRVSAGDTASGLWAVLIGWSLKDAVSAGCQRLHLNRALRGLAVRDAMLTEVATIPGYVALSELAREHFLRGGYKSYPVVRGENVVGLLSLHQVLAVAAEDRSRTSVQAVMTRLAAAIVAEPGEPLLEVMTRMARARVGRLLVVEDGRLAGLLSVSSVFRHMRMREALSP